MINSAFNYPISQLFDTAADVVYVIPRYQREYTWRKVHWESVFDDIVENNPGYFLGSIICINQSKDALSVQRLELVDGQQRLTTISLLFAAVYDALREYENDLDEDRTLEILNLKRKLVLKRGDGQLRVVPQIQNNNQEDYRAVLAKIGVISPSDIPPYAGNRKIFRAFYYFQSRIKELANYDHDPIEAIVDFLDKVNKASLVKIEVVSHADAYILFESLNNRGMPLTAIDLIKNKLLARLESSKEGRIDYYYGHWNRLLDYLGDDYGTQERFFRQYYNAFRNELKAEANVPVATRSNLIQIYEKLINHDAKGILQKLSNATKLYALLLLRNQDEALNGLKKPLQNLDQIQGAPSYLLLLYFLVKKHDLGLDENQLAEIIGILVKFFVRRNLTDTPPTRDLTRMFMKIVETITQLKGDQIVSRVREHLVKVSADDSVFREKLAGPIYDENYGVTRFILCALAEQAMTRETWQDLWQVKKKNYVWTVEHIFPKGKNIPEEWVNMIADGDKEKAKDIQEMHVHKLGNLTLSAYNSNLGNMKFEDKRDRKDRDGRYIGYKNKLKLNEDLEDETTWSVQKIEARTDKLVQQVMDLFKMN